MFASLQLNDPPKKSMTSLLFRSLQNKIFILEHKDTRKEKKKSQQIQAVNNKKKKVHCFKYVNKRISLKGE